MITGKVYVVGMVYVLNTRFNMQSAVDDLQNPAFRVSPVTFTPRPS